MCGPDPKMSIYNDNGTLPLRQNMIHSVHNWWKKYVMCNTLSV